MVTQDYERILPRTKQLNSNGAALQRSPLVVWSVVDQVTSRAVRHRQEERELRQKIDPYADVKKIGFNLFEKGLMYITCQTAYGYMHDDESKQAPISGAS